MTQCGERKGSLPESGVDQVPATVLSLQRHTAARNSHFESKIQSFIINRFDSMTTMPCHDVSLLQADHVVFVAHEDELGSEPQSTIGAENSI